MAFLPGLQNAVFILVLSGPTIWCIKDAQYILTNIKRNSVLNLPLCNPKKGILSSTCLLNVRA